jgi:N-acetylmuramoyl-L-alanine amidase
MGSASCLAALCLISTFLLVAAQSDEKRLSVYSNAANYSLQVSDQNGLEYVGLFEILEPLGTVSARVEGKHWKLRFGSIEGEFTSGKPNGRIQGKNIDFGGPFELENGRGLVPVSSLATLLPRFLGGPVMFHENSRRLFIGSAAVHFTAQIERTNPSHLVLDFTSPVNPTISTEPGKLRMLFKREPLVPPGTNRLTFDDKIIPSATYLENNGAAEIEVSGTAPLFATFSHDGQTITVAPAPQTLPAATEPTPAPAGAPGFQPPAPAVSIVARRFFAVIDASHGGEERGAALDPQLPEKDVTLAFARSLRQELVKRGIAVLMVRDSDTTLPLDDRAAMANQAHPAIYISIHATTQGNGVRLYTSVLPLGQNDRGPFLDWNTAQSSSVANSQAAAGVMAEGLQKLRVPVRILEAPLRPLNSITATAVAVEIAPPSTALRDLTSIAYQQSVAATIASAVLGLRSKWESGR